MSDDDVLAQALEDPDRLDDGAWTTLAAELRRDPGARAELRALLRQDQRIARGVGRAIPATRRGVPTPTRTHRPTSRRIRTRTRSSPWFMVMATAAVLAIAVLAWMQLQPQPTPTSSGIMLIQASAERSVAPGERIAAGVPVTVRWQDGTTVALSATAIARVESTERMRLDAGFCRAEVVPRVAQRFSIVTAQADVTVLGTAFTVAYADAATEVSVERGLVRVQGSAGGQVELGAAAATRIAAGKPPEPRRQRWPSFIPANIIARRGELFTPNAGLAAGPDGPELASAYQYRETQTTGIRLVPATPIRYVPGLRLHLRYRAIRPLTSVTMQCANDAQGQNFQAVLPLPPADGSWFQTSIEVADLIPVLRQTPWKTGETMGNLLLTSEQPQTTEDVLRLGDFAFSTPQVP